MRLHLSIILAIAFINFTYAQQKTDKKLIEEACMNYLDAFYKGDVSKIVESVKPTLHKYGYVKDYGSGVYNGYKYMTYQQAKDYVQNVLDTKNFPDKDAPKTVEVLDIMNHIAAAKVNAWWGMDYMLLSKNGGKWMIEQVLWEGPGHAYAKQATDKERVNKACMNYLDAFYQGDVSKIVESIKPTLHKYGYWKDEGSGNYNGYKYMTYEQAKEYVQNVSDTKNFPAQDAPKAVEILDIMNHIAIAKVTAWWGIDYIMLSESGDKWIIEQVLWEGPLVTVAGN